ncbi:MAG: hypothetical protein C0404_10575, partial [Verrucomicrobia bacterium]|nr:hypothetical protein [Verrucomicrobiota bacterium]
GALLCANRLVWGFNKDKVSAIQKKDFNRELKAVRSEMSKEWDRTRFSVDPRKYKVVFPGDEAGYIMILVRRLQPM